jgi:hypothetical protein
MKKTEDMKNAKKRCAKGTRRNKKTGDCIKTNPKTPSIPSTAIPTVIPSTPLTPMAIQTNRKSPPKPVDVPKHIREYFSDRHEKLAKVLEKTCSTRPDKCVAVGSYSELIKHYFNGFTDFSLIGEPTTIASSNNGIILRIPYKKHGYSADCIMKLPVNQFADNLYYEYYVGKYFINRLATRFPCFLETYDIYFTTDKPKPSANFVRGLNRFRGTWNESCAFPTHLALLIQYFPSNMFMSFMRMYKDHTLLFMNSLCSYLYQIYFVLSVLGDTYTHYDLHAENACLYQPYTDPNCYIEMHYHLKNDRIISFPTRQIVKIIDYGRNYFNNGGTNSKEILESVCLAKSCKPECGKYQGYAMIRGTIREKNRPEVYHIHPNMPNTSHDLRLAKTFQPILDKVGFGVNIVYQTQYGTPEKTCDHGIGHYTKTVHNVMDMRLALERTHPKWKIEYGKPNVKAAEMHIYEDGRDYQYIVLDPNAK